MAGGFEVFGLNGFKMGGTDFANLVLYGKTVLTTGAFSVLGPGFDGSQYIGAVAVPKDGSVLRFYRPVSGDSHFLEQDGKLFSVNPGSQFECYSFGPAVVSGGNEGIEFYRESDQALTFSATKPFLKLAGVFVDPTQHGVPEDPAAYPYSVSTVFREGGRKFAYQFSNAHYHYRLVRPAGRSYNVSYNSVRMAFMTSAGQFHSRYVSRYMWTHPWAHARVWEVPNRSAPQRMLIADVTGL